MGTPKDAQRIAAFRNFVRHIGGVQRAVDHLGIGERAIRRMISTEPPPAAMLERLASEVAADPRAVKLARQLATAAEPAALPMSDDGGDALADRQVERVEDFDA